MNDLKQALVDYDIQGFAARNSSLEHSKLSTLRVAVVGGSNSVMRNGYTKYLSEYLAAGTGKQVELSYYALGGVPSLFGAIQNIRNNISTNNDVIFFEYCVNDRTAVFEKKYSLELAGVSLEGFIRRAKRINPSCRIVILIFGENTARYYNSFCQVSSLYESIAKRYKIPVINVTELLLVKRGIDFIKSLYEENEYAHYSRPKGVKVVARLIVDQIIAQKMLDKKQKPLDKIYRVYANNLENLNFYDEFDSSVIQGEYEKSVFENSLFQENLITIRQGSSLNFCFQGRLIGIILKSDWYDGFFRIKLGSRQVVTSSFSSWVRQEGKVNLNLITFADEEKFKSGKVERLSISLCEAQPEEFELDWHKTIPQVEPANWKLSIVGIAYVGKILSENVRIQVEGVDKETKAG